jgi:hypothetical protein
VAKKRQMQGLIPFALLMIVGGAVVAVVVLIGKRRGL